MVLILCKLYQSQYDPEHAACKAGHRILRKMMKLEEKANKAVGGERWDEAVKLLSELNLVDRDLIVMRIPVLVKVKYSDIGVRNKPKCTP